LHCSIGKVFGCAAQVAGRGDRVVIKKINQFPARRAQGGVALDGRLFAARNDDILKLGWIIQLSRRRDRLDVGMVAVGRRLFTPRG
jgi:hypothetical protein